MIEDAELLRRYADSNANDAFAELVRRRVNLVYSVALRQVGGDAHLAEDVTQRVFADLARKARTLSGHAVLSGWLYRSAQFAASDVVRSERRRRAREQEAQTMNETSLSPGAEIEWEKFRPLLDETMGELDDDDRDALALRFFEERSFPEIGSRLELTEDAARKRVARALDKMHGLLSRRGVTSTTAALAMALANQVSVAAPAGLAATVTSAALGGAAAGVGAGMTFLKIMSLSKLTAGVAGVCAVVAAGVVFFEVKASKETRSELSAVLRERDDLQAKVRTLEGQVATQTQRATAAEEDVDRLLQGVKDLQTAQGAAAAAAAVPITHDVVEGRYKRAQELARNGHGEEALKEFLWCFDEGMPRVSGYTGVRLSFLLSQIEKIGPAGLAALRERRDAARTRMLAGEKDLNAAMDFSAINRTLKEDDQTIAVYDQLPVGDSRRKTLASAAYEQLVSARRYADALEARSYAQMSSLFELTTQDRPLPANVRDPEKMREMRRNATSRSTMKNIEVLAGAGDVDNARKLAERLLAYDGSDATKAALQEHLSRAGHPELLSTPAK